MVDLSNLQRMEYAVLATALIDPSVVGNVVATLSPEDFSLAHTRGLFAAISELHLSGAPTDVFSVIQKAGRGYEVAVKEVIPWETSPGTIPHYCKSIKESGQLRKIQLEAATIAGTESLDEAEEIMNRVSGLLVQKKRVNILSMSQAALDFYAQLDGDPPEYLTWGMKELDELLEVELGDFVLVGGYPSAGKTLLSIQFALELARKYRVGYFSLETSTRKMYDRALSHVSQIPLKKIKRRDLSEADYVAIAEATAKLNALRLELIDAGGMTVRDIQAITRNKRFEVILVDYLQLVSMPGRDRYEQVTAISLGLKTMARENNVACIALAQLSRPDKTQGKPKPPTMSSFRESGQIEQDADVAMLLWPADPNDNRSRRVLKVAKNKEGGRDKFELDFDGACQTLRPAVPTQSEKYREIHKQIREAGKAAHHQIGFEELTGRNDDLPF